MLSEAQAERLALQQQIFRQALDDLSRNADEFWDSFFEFEVEDAVELLLPEHLEDPEYVDIEVVSYAMGIDTIHHDFPLIPDTAIERAYREVLSRLRAIKPSFE